MSCLRSATSAITSSNINNICCDSNTSSIKTGDYTVTWSPYLINTLKVKEVIYNDPATIVYFSDGSKSVVKRHKDDIFDKQTGLLMCIAKRFLGKEELHKTLRNNTENYD